VFLWLIEIYYSTQFYMHNLRFLWIALLFSFIVTGVFSQSGRIEGRVYNAKNNEPLPFTNIIVWGTQIGSTSDLDGRFVFTGLQPGYIRLAASSVGFETYISEDLLITNAKTVFIEIAMKETSVQLEQVEIKASPFRRVEESPLSMRSLSLKEIERNPGGNRDISKVIQSLPGVSSSVSFRNDVIVRGGGSSENRFYLDGMEIPNLNHFATQGASGGPVGMINVDFIREVDFYSGAFPANRGNALSSVLEFKQIDGNKDKFSLKELWALLTSHLLSTARSVSELPLLLQHEDPTFNSFLTPLAYPFCLPTMTFSSKLKPVLT
jgi:hypothetical protein